MVSNLSAARPLLWVGMAGLAAVLGGSPVGAEGTEKATQPLSNNAGQPTGVTSTEVTNAELVQVKALRARLEASALRAKAAAVVFPDIKNITISGSYGDIPLRIYSPAAKAPLAGPSHNQPGLPGIFYIHGAGWVAGGLDSHDNILRLLALKANAVVVSIDYRLAPAFKYPVALDESYAGLQWFFKEAQRLGVDPARIAVAGDSAGGNLAAALTLLSRDRKGPAIRAQLLINPVLDVASFDTASYKAATPAQVGMMVFFRAQYVGALPDLRQPYLSPALAADFSGLPPAFVISSELDALRDEDQAYIRALNKAGVVAAGFMVKGIGHLGMTWATADPKIDEALGAGVAFLNQEFK